VVVAGYFLWVTCAQLVSFEFAPVFGYGYIVYCDVVAIYGYLAFSMAFLAAALDFSGFVKSIYLVNISFSVSISSSFSSSMVARGGVSVAFRVFLSICAVGVLCYPEPTLSTCSCLMKRAHGVAPSISSRFLRRFLKPSIERNKEWTDGVLSLFSPFALALCFAPIAAWSCFSTAVI
jgi:hypothetical protein